MPRHRRVLAPGELVHVISRFVDRVHVLALPGAREEYARRLAHALAESDWRAVSYALMSSHVHLGLVVGSTPFEQLMVRAHAPFAQWVNRRRSGLGPILADRPKSLSLDPPYAGRLIAYHHNNPVRAGVVRSASDSTWTSHRAYLGEAPRPPWLDVRLGLALMRLPSTPDGRCAMGRYVDDRRDDRVIPEVWDPDEERKRLRREVGLAVDVQHPRASSSRLEFNPRVTRHRWRGDVGELLAEVSKRLRVTAEALAGPSRVSHVTEARRVVVLAGLALGLRSSDLARALGRTGPGVRKLAQGAGDRSRSTAADIAAALRRSAPEQAGGGVMKLEPDGRG